MLEKTTELFNKEFRGSQQTGFRRGQEFGQLGVNYRGSPIILDERYPENQMVDPYRAGEDGTVRGGDRAPDAPALVKLGKLDAAQQTSTSLFEILKPMQHTALIFPGSTSDAFVTEMLKTLCEYPSGTVRSVVLFSKSSSAKLSFDLADMTVIDSQRLAYTHYAIDKDAMVIIVRPDGYIGAVVSSGRDGIQRYFAGIFL